jgi:hypothetical protein
MTAVQSEHMKHVSFQRNVSQEIGCTAWEEGEEWRRGEGILNEYGVSYTYSQQKRIFSLE